MCECDYGESNDGSICDGCPYPDDIYGDYEPEDIQSLNEYIQNREVE